MEFLKEAALAQTSTVLIIARVPETKDRSLEEIGHELGAEGEPATQPS